MTHTLDNGRPLVTCFECHRTGENINQDEHGNPEEDNLERVEKYIVIDNLRFPIFNKEWSAKEELLLI